MTALINSMTFFVIGPIFYPLCTTDIWEVHDIIIATFVYYTIILHINVNLEFLKFTIHMDI